MPADDPEPEPLRCPGAAPEALLRGLDGPDEHDVRRPVPRTGTDLLGPSPHGASVAAGYPGVTPDREEERR